MEEAIIDCTQIQTKEDLHRVFRDTLCFPDWYGNNLDALYDCLTEINHQTQITFYGLDALDFADGFRDTLLDAEANNFWLHISFT